MTAAQVRPSNTNDVIEDPACLIGVLQRERSTRREMAQMR